MSLNVIRTAVSQVHKCHFVVTKQHHARAIESRIVTAEVQGLGRIIEFIHDVYHDGNIHYPLEWICDSPLQTSYFRTVLLTNEYILYPITMFERTVDGASLLEISGPIQGYHGVEYIEIFAEACWNEGPCAGHACAGITDTVSIIIP